jgi:RNA polymerase sigma-70 factor (ECF subfamily)
MRQVQLGNKGALAHLVQRHQLEAVRVAFGIVLDRDSAEELAQRAFIAAWVNARQFTLARPFRPWFFRIVVNLALKEAQRQQRLQPISSVEYQLAESAASMVALIEASETNAELYAAISNLAPAQRAVIVQRYFLGLSEAEMSDQLGVPAGTIKSRLFAARRTLRQLLQPLHQ